MTDCIQSVKVMLYYKHSPFHYLNTVIHYFIFFHVVCRRNIKVDSILIHTLSSINCINLGKLVNLRPAIFVIDIIILVIHLGHHP